MSIAHSNLGRYSGNNVDMTVSITEQAINSQMRQYLASMTTASKVENYQAKIYIISHVDDNGNQLMFSVDKNTDYSKLPAGFPPEFIKTVSSLEENNSSLFEEFEKLNLFCISSGTKSIISLTSEHKVLSSDALNISIAASYFLKYAIFIEDGIPDALLAKLLDGSFTGDLDTVLKPLSLQPNKKNVLFKQFFRNICGLQLSTSTSGSYPKISIVTTLSKSEQTDDHIWYFPFDISLDFRATDYASCGKEVQDKIIQMANVDNPDSVFNISQLALDLKTLSTTMSPTIKSFDHDVDSFLTNIIRSYFDRLEKAGQTIFGSVITTKPTSTTKYLFTPKMRNYHVGPRTLNYLIGFGKEKIIPNLGNDNNFLWDSNDSPLLASNNQNNAAIAISSHYFLPFISMMMQPVLKHLRNNIEVFADDPVWKGQFHVWAESKPQGGNPSFESGGTPGNPTFVYTYQSRNETERHFMWQPPIPAPVASLKLRHTYSAEVNGTPGSYKFENVVLPAFIFDFHIKGWLLVDYNTNEKTQGTYFDTTLRMAIGIRIDSQTGNIDFIKGKEQINHNPPGLPRDGWVEFMSANNINDYVNTLIAMLNNILSEVEKYSFDEFVNSINSQIGFVMPGSKTFTFLYDKPNGTVNAITPSGDLYLFGNYVQELAK